MNSLETPKRSFSRLRRGLACAGCVLLAGVIPLPLSITSRDHEKAAKQALTALLKNRLVLTNRGCQRLLEADYFQSTPGFLFLNETAMHDATRINAIQHVMLADSELAYISASFRDIRGETKSDLQWSYLFGPLAGHGYEIKIYKSLLIRYLVFHHRWTA